MSDVYIGIDEAGRGPFIGEMVLCAVRAKNTELPQGVVDSKLLTPKKREELYEHLITLPHAIRICSVKEIDTAVAKNGLNWLEADKTAELINELGGGRVIVDCPAKNLGAYKDYLSERCPGADIHVQYKADLEHPVVGAASIIAKVVRDRAIKALHDEVGVDFGSGYLTDPKTQEFLKTMPLDWPHARKSWKTHQALAAQREQKTLF